MLINRETNSLEEKINENCFDNNNCNLIDRVMANS